MNEKKKKLYEVLDPPERSVFDNARRTVIREMEAIKEYDVESCVLYLADAMMQIAKLQQFAIHNTEMKISDIKGDKEKRTRKKWLTRRNWHYIKTQVRWVKDSCYRIKEKNKKVA